MRARTVFAIASLIGLAAAGLVASPLQVAEAATGQKTLAATINVYVFPTEGQTAEVQSQHEVECYNWAVQNTGTDPFDLGKQAEQQKQQAAEAEQQAQQVGQGAGAGAPSAAPPPER